MLLRVPAEELGEALTHKTSYIHKELFTVLLNVKQSVGQRDQLVQNFHVILFAFVVEMANYKLAPIGETPTQIVLLDQASFQTKGDKLWELNCESEEGGYSGHVNRSSEYADGAFWIAIVGVWDIQMVLGYPREKFGMSRQSWDIQGRSLGYPDSGVWDAQWRFGIPTAGHGISKGEVWDIQTVEFGMSSGGLGFPHCSFGTSTVGLGLPTWWVWDIHSRTWDAHIVAMGHPQHVLGCPDAEFGTPTVAIKIPRLQDVMDEMLLYKLLNPRSLPTNWGIRASQQPELQQFASQMAPMKGNYHRGRNSLDLWLPQSTKPS
ncbi:hypothetical protein BU15DRAFT_63560 [Melanogaster broomeanus]|nr:hypothetical protein BU15DRAFT_63560 [Melanogaster broomeanus]